MKIAKLAAACLLVSSPAIAGEIGGNGEYTPINSYTANSLCAFSGRNDDGAGNNARVQSYGMVRAIFGGPAPFHGLPGTECNGS